MAKAIKTKSIRASRTKQHLPVEDMTGGMDLRRSPTLIAPNRAQKLKNWGIGEPGALTVQPGYTVVSSAAFGTVRAQGGQRAYVGGTAFSLVAYDGVVYRPSDAWVRGAAVHSTVSTANQVFFPFDRDLVMVMDGANRPRFSTNGTNWFLAGIDAPSSAPTLSTVSTGGLSSGIFDIVYTYKHRGTAHESNPSTFTTSSLAASSGSIHATASPSTDPKVDAYIWYARKTSEGESIFRKFSSGSASTVTINSSGWTANTEAPSNHNVPPDGLRFGTSWKSRWWAPHGTILNRLHFTELFLPQAWPTLYYIDIPFVKGDSITSITPIGDTLVVRGQSSAFLVIGQTALDFEVRPSQANEGGAFGPRSAIAVSQAEVHASADGVDRFDLASDGSLEDDIQKAWLDLVKNSDATSLNNIAMVYDTLSQQVRISVPRVYPSGSQGEWVLNLDRTRDEQGVPAWSNTDWDPHLYIHWNGNEPTQGNRNRLFFLPKSTNGMVYEINDNASANASANSSNVTAEYEGPALSMGLHNTRFVDLHLEHEPHGGSFSVEPVVDGVSMGSISMDIGTGLYVYGASDAVYGTATYGGTGRRKAYTPLPMQAYGRSIVLKFTYIGQERMKVFSYTFGVVPDATPLQVV